jgi:serine/threonine protein kinase
LTEQDRDEPWVDLTWAIAQRKCLHDIMASEPLYDFEGYEAIKTIEGGMGLVIVARDPNLGRKVAIKLCKSSGPDAALAMLGEAQALAKLSHPNVVTIHGVGESELGIFLVMEFVDGLDAEAWLVEKLRSLAEILGVFIGAGEGLAAAHEAGIQHGDFKPANVLIGKDGRVRVADFGVAEVMREATLDELFGGGVAGTPEYMAPSDFAASGGMLDRISSRFVWRWFGRSTTSGPSTGTRAASCWRRSRLASLGLGCRSLRCRAGSSRCFAGGSPRTRTIDIRACASFWMPCEAGKTTTSTMSRSC